MNQLSELYACSSSSSSPNTCTLNDEHNNKGWSYFEATVWGEGSVGIVSIHNSRDRKLYGSSSQLHIGWKGDSYGYHNDDGCVFVSNPTTRPTTVHHHRNQLYRYRKIRYGPIWGTTTDSINNNDNTTAIRPNGADPRETHTREEYEDRNNNHMSKHNLSSVVGCGYNPTTNELFFTLDGRFLGLVPCSTSSGVKYAASVTLHGSGDKARLNFGRFPFVFDVDHFCLASPLIEKSDTT
eukprot:CAMPEP_0194359568 /NCGR_PEP_ID=MMETSP0174-20130528/6820_1 /TAXON_ID=216777 /ORGANISM="Proboscia alata, Strain PI-D3" /LENGTH=237 /DNA_ID=CAMNT_0039130523 /DNA_START=611 /DNA_END=1324 /DNA_ORIENTATION=+